MPSALTILTMRIEKISAPDRSGKYTVRFDDAQTMRLYRQTVEDFGLYPGMELTDEELTHLRDAAGKMSAKMRAVRIVSATGVSKRDLHDRLVQKGEKPADAAEAVHWMEQMQLLDDAQTANAIVERCIRKGYGLSRAKQALYEKRIPREYWDAALADYPDQSECISDFLRAKLTGDSDRNEVRKAIDALIRRGHSYGVIRRCLNDLDFDTDEYPEDAL